jgi:hypothetical protein
LNKRSRSTAAAPPDRLRELSQRWRRDDGSSRVVPVVGAGLNIQAAREAGGAPEDNWDELLKSVLKRVHIAAADIKRLPASFIQRWETIVRWYTAAKLGWRPFKGEGILQGEICDYLREVERQTHAYPLFKDFATAGFRDIVSLNFDRRLALAAGGGTVITAVPRAGIHEQALYRHSRISAREGLVTRIWYPHGDTKKKETLKLGVRKYGLYIAEIDALRGRYMNHWYKCDEHYQRSGGTHWALPTDVWDDLVRTWPEGQSWACVFMSAPLLFIGCGLGHEEWPLWWLLNQRARQTTYLDQPNASPRPDTIVLTAGATAGPDHLQRDLCHIENIHFPTYEAMWSAVRGCLLPSVAGAKRGKGT